MRVSKIKPVRGQGGNPSYWNVTVAHGQNTYDFRVIPVVKGYAYAWGDIFVDGNFNVTCTNTPFTQLVLLHSLIGVFRAQTAFKELPALPAPDKQDDEKYATYPAEIEKLLARATEMKREPVPDELMVTALCVCQSGAGYYIGRWCIEWDGSQWFPQPYDRQSEYMTGEEAKAQLESMMNSRRTY